LLNNQKQSKMKNLKEKFELTELENEMLNSIVKSYDADDNICFSKKLTASEKGIIGSLVKKGLIYDSFENMGEDGNFFPNEEILEYLEIN